jgi:hypothetical protein
MKMKNNVSIRNFGYKINGKSREDGKIILKLNEVAQDRVQWRVPVITVRGIGFHYRREFTDQVNNHNLLKALYNSVS